MVFVMLPRLAVLNHLGAVSDVQLTSPRIYTYGEFTHYEPLRV